MKRAMFAVVAAFALAAAFLGGYVFGSQKERAAWEPAVADTLASKTLVVIQRDVQLLTAAREKKDIDWVRELELWAVLQLQYIDPNRYVKGSAADSLYPKTIEMVNLYRKQYPDTAIDPDRDGSIAKAFGPRR